MNFRLNPVHCGVALLCLSFSASAVAQESAAELKARIKQLEAQLEESEVSCLFVSHDRYFTRAAATRFLEIRKGRLVEVEAPDDFFEAQ